MSNRIPCPLLLVVLMALSSVAQGQGQGTDLEALKKKQAELDQRLVQIQDQIRQVKKGLAAEGEVAALQKSLEQARVTYEKKLRADEKVVSAKKAADAADELETRTVDALAAQDKSAQALADKAKANVEALASIDKQRRQIQAKLMEVRKRLEAEPDLAAAVANQRKAEQAMASLPQTDPGLQAASKAVEAARKALEEKIRTLPEKQALDAAIRAYDQAVKTSPELASLRKARDAAKAALEEKLSAKTAADAEGAAQLKALADLKDQVKQLRSENTGLDSQLSKIKHDLAKADPKAIEARQAADLARGAYRQAIAEQLRSEKSAVTEAEKAYNDLLESKLSADPKVVELRKQMQEINQQLHEVHDQIRKAKGATPQ